MEYIANHIELTGCLASAPQFSHDNHGRRFFSFYLEVARLSGTVDRLPVLAPEPLLQSVEASEGASLRVEGQIRSFNSRTPAGRRLIISVLAETLCVYDAPHDNEVTLLAVDRDVHGLGVGTVLLDAAVSHLSSLGATRAHLYTDSNCSWKFYELHGFKRTATHRANREERRHDMPRESFLYELDLTA